MKIRIILTYIQRERNNGIKICKKYGSCVLDNERRTVEALLVTVDFHCKLFKGNTLDFFITNSCMVGDFLFHSYTVKQH